MTDIPAILQNPVFDGMTITEALDYCIEQDPANPTRMIVQRAQYQNDEQLVRDYAENPEIKEGLWRMHQAGKINCTCEAIAMNFNEFDSETREIVIRKVEQLLK